MKYNIQILDHTRSIKLFDMLKKGLWNWKLLSSWVSLDIIAKLASILPPDDRNGVDMQICKESPMGRFLISEMYHALCGFNDDKLFSTWHCIWRLKVLERVRVFIWLVKHGRLLTNVLKRRLGLGYNRCDYYHEFEESTLHVLHDCPSIKLLLMHAVTMRLQY